MSKLDSRDGDAMLAELLGQAGRDFNGKAVPPVAARPPARDDDATSTPPARPAPLPAKLAETAVEMGRTTDTEAPVGFDLVRLLEGRLLVQGNSGAGKSMLLRRLAEQAFGRVQLLVVDPDGEFNTLAEHFDFAVVAAADALRVGGGAFARHLREHRYSAVLDLSDATAEDQLRLSADLCSGLIECPEDFRAPLLVLVDEAQTLAPHFDTGDVEPDTRKAAIAALADLMGRGRKRGIAGVVATQRLAETSKAVVSKATNVVVGRTIFDRDLERAGAVLGFTAGHSRALRTLGDGEFLAIGPAIAGPRRIRFRAGPVTTRHRGATPRLEAPPAISGAQAAKLLAAVPDADGERPAATGKKPRRGWSAAEDEIVVAGYREKLQVREISERLAAAGFRRRAISGISQRAQSLGLSSARAARQYTDEEDRIIVDAYAREVRLADIVQLLADAGHERGRVSVQMRAIHLGITRDRVNYWTAEEKRIAIEGLEAGRSNREIIADLKAAGFERGVSSVSKFAQRNDYNRAAEQWTPDELDILRQRYAEKVPPKRIAEELGKPVGGIRSKASQMGLKQRVPWTEAERAILHEVHEAGGTLVEAHTRIGRPYPNVAAEARRLQLDFRNRKSRQ